VSSGILTTSPVSVGVGVKQACVMVSVFCIMIVDVYPLPGTMLIEVWMEVATEATVTVDTRTLVTVATDVSTEVTTWANELYTVVVKSFSITLVVVYGISSVVADVIVS
jgi:hypothetical protein